MLICYIIYYICYIRKMQCMRIEVDFITKRKTTFIRKEARGSESIPIAYA